MKQGLQTQIGSSFTQSEWPDPIMELDQIIGFSNNFPRTLLWLPDGSACVYTSSSTIILREFCSKSTTSELPEGGAAEIDTSTKATKGSVKTTGSIRSSSPQREHFLYGHSAAVCALAVTADGSLLASAEVPENSKHSCVRIWDLASRECITVIKAQSKGTHGLCFSLPSKRLLLCAVGRDECSRTQIFVWDCSCLQHTKERSQSGAVISLLARQTSDFPIERIAFSPYEQQNPYHLVSCGRENVRYWRVNTITSHLTGCPVLLNEYSRGTLFTDIAFDTFVETHPSNINRVRPLYVTSSVGTLLAIDYDSKLIICVYQLHDASINCLSVNEGFCVTGSDDCYLRVWPLDFTDFFLEAHHEAGVSALDVSADGMKVLVGSRNNAIGVLDIADQQYATLLRSHTMAITAMTSAPWGSPLTSLLIKDLRPGKSGSPTSNLVTASSDGTLRVWDPSSGQQLLEFDIQQERVTSLVASPVQSGIVAVGFASGYIRIFDVHRASLEAEETNDDGDKSDAPSSMLHEFRQHQSSICHVAFDADSQHLFTSGAGKELCLYDARQHECLPLKMLLVDFDPDDGRFVVSHDKKWLAVVSGDRQDVVLLDPCSLDVVSKVRPPKQGQKETLKLARFVHTSVKLLVLSASDRLHMFSLPEKALLMSMPLFGQAGISALAMSANANYMVTGSSDGSLYVWNWDDKGRSDRMHQSFLGHAGKVDELVFTNDGKRIVSAGESNAIYVWRFHGDMCCLSPRVKSIDLLSTKQFSNENAGKDLFPFKSVSPASSKQKFELSLESDAFLLRSSTECDEVDAVISNRASRETVESAIPTIAVRTGSDVSNELSLAGVFGGFDPLNFGWSSSTGALLRTTRSLLVVEDIASGHQTFYDDFNSAKTEQSNTSDENLSDSIVLLELSPSGENVAMVSSRFDNVVVRSLVIREKKPEDTNVNSMRDADRILIALPVATKAVTCLAFSRRSRQTQVDELLCMACDIDTLQCEKQSAVIVASTTRQCIIWSKMNCGATESTNFRQIVATTDSEFLLLSSTRSSVFTLTVHDDEPSSDSIEPSAELEVLIKAFPTPVKLLSLYNVQGSINRPRYVVGIDDDRYCYFYDLQHRTFLATTQLLLLSCHGNDQADDKVKPIDSSKQTVDFMEWVTTTGKSLLITGSRRENILYVHGLPMSSTKHSARVQVDWKRVARAGVSLMCKITLDGSGLLRSLSVDPARDIGIATSDDGTVVLVHFGALPATKVLRETSSARISNGLQFKASHAIWALSGAVLLSKSRNDNAIRVWLPELMKEVACFHVDSATCTSLAVNPFSITPDGISQSMVMAGYSDGSVRVVDLCKMQLLARFELRPWSAKSARFEGRFCDRIVFVGVSTALVVTNDNRVVLLDLSSALECSKEVKDTKGTSMRSTPPKRATSRQRAKASKEKSRTRATRNNKSNREVTYRELTLVPPGYNCSNSEQVQVQVGAIQVMETAWNDAQVHPFLLVLLYTGPASYGKGRRVIKVFADPRMSLSRGEEIAPTDEWIFNNALDLDQSVAAFIPSPSPASLQVSYLCLMQNHAAATEWGLEIRDCIQQRVVQRLSFDAQNPLEMPTFLHCTHTDSTPDNMATITMLLVDASGRMAVLDLIQHRLTRISSQTANNLHLRFSSFTHNNNNNILKLLLSSTTQLAVATLAVH